MKKFFKYPFAIVLGLSLCSCDKLFDSVEGDLSKMSGEDMVSSQAGLERILSDVYNSIPMDAFNTKEKNTLLATSSRATDYSIDVSGFWNYTKMRSINNFIKLLDQALDKNIISQNDHDEMLGEAIFARAYCYFGMVRRYGGVPIVTEPLDDYYDGKENAGLYVPRSTEKETWDFVISELDRAAELLPESRTDGKYRATKWAALGLQSRVALYAASVSKYWSKEAIPSSYAAVSQKLTYMEASYADTYYAKCIEACDKIINSNKFSLYGGATTSVAKAKENLTKLFLERQDCEFIFGKSYNTGVTTATHNFDINNSPNQAHGIMTSQGWGNMSLTVDLVDLYDDYDANGGRADGTVKTRNDGNEYEFFSQIGIPASTFDPNIDFIEYDNLADPFLNKDARFQAWVLYPGCNFRGLTIVCQAGFIKPDGTSSFYEELQCDVGNVRYFALGGSSILSEDNTNPKFLSSNVSAFVHMGDKSSSANSCEFWNTCFGPRKFLDPDKTVQYSTNPWCDIRYAEILLNYAEAVAESGLGDAAKAKKYLNDIRHRAAFTDDIELTVENVCHERKVEFVMEGHESYTLYRRREYLNSRGGAQYRKHTLLPLLDLRGDTPKYIFARANVYHGDIQFSSSGLNTDPLDYYGGISNFSANGLTPNPSQE